MVYGANWAQFFVLELIKLTFEKQIEMMQELTAENRRDSAPESTEQRWKVRRL